MPAKLEISLDNLKSNIQNIQEYIKENSNSKSVKILAMVKADAYGAGIIEVSKTLEKSGIDYLGVAYLKEAKLLKQNGIKSDIVVFSGLLPEDILEAVKTDSAYSISNIEIAKMLNEESKKQNKKVKIHIAVDTGMGRIGVLPKDISNFSKEIVKLTNLEIEGIFSHFSSADSDLIYTKRQNNIFKECVEEFRNNGINPKFVHICNSVGIAKHDTSYNDMVRVGIAMYGYLKTEVIKLKGIFKLSAPICDIRTVPAGEAIGYSKTYITDKETKIATLQIGYADGLNRLLSNKYELNINGRNSKILGNICMDMTMIDVTDVDNIKIGDYVNIFDFEDNKLDEMAKICNTINYEIISTIGKRVDREYIN